MDKLTIGQRIDVYEVVANVDELPSLQGRIGDQFLGKVSEVGGVEIYNPEFATPNKTLFMFDWEVKKSGTLKVKSLKGGNNES